MVTVQNPVTLTRVKKSVLRPLPSKIDLDQRWKRSGMQNNTASFRQHSLA